MNTHVIVCGSETEINIVTQQRLAISALIAKVDAVTSSGKLDEKTEGELRELVACTRASFKFNSRQHAAE